MSYSAVFVGATLDGLLLEVGDEREEVSWHEIDDISVGEVASRGEITSFVMAIGLSNGRTIVIREGQPVWRYVLDALPLALPEAKPFATWSTALLEAPAFVIYSR